MSTSHRSQDAPRALSQQAVAARQERHAPKPRLLAPKERMSLADPNHATKNILIALLPRLCRFARCLTARDGKHLALVEAACTQITASPADQRDKAAFNRHVLRVLYNCWRGVADVDTAHLDAPSDGRPFSGQHADVPYASHDLPAELAAALLLVTTERLSYADAAEVLDLPKNTLRFRVCQARKMIAAQRMKAQY